MCHANIRSLQANLSALSDYFECLCIDFSIIGLSETWLSDEKPEELFGMLGYTITGKHRNNGQGGGVAIYVR